MWPALVVILLPAGRLLLELLVKPECNAGEVSGGVLDRVWSALTFTWAQALVK
jgi:hypothetical protein